MSAFIRRQPVRSQDLGTRPGLHGQVLISSGLAGVDRLLGGGLPLGCILLIIEDNQSSQHLNLLKCFMAEGVCCKHTVAWVAAQQLTRESIAAFLPEQARAGSSSSSHQAQKQESSSSSTTPGQQQQQPDDGLKIAWQYRKYIQQQQRGESITGSSSSSRGSSAQPSSSTAKHVSSSSSSSAAAKAVAAGIGREWCHQYDLSRSLTPAQLQGCRFESYCCHSGDGSAVEAAAQAAAAFVQRFQQAPLPVPGRDPGTVGRLIIQSLGGPDWWPSGSSSGSSSSSWSALEASILQAIARLRLQLQDTTCAAVVTCPTELFSESFRARLQHLADAVLSLQSLADNSDVFRLLPDPTSASALLEVRRLPHLGLLRQRFTDDKLYLLRHKRRSISVAVLDLLPLEAVEGDAGKQQGGGNKPAAAHVGACGAGSASHIDF